MFGSDTHLNLNEMKKKNRQVVTKVLVDPPSGWIYGFPKAVEKSVLDKISLRSYVLENGYPQSEIDKYGDNFFIRTTEYETED